MRDPRELTADTAAHWVARLASGEATADELNWIKVWLAADPAHQQAFDHARRVWAGLAPLEQITRRSVLRPWRIIVASATAAAACVMLAILGGRFVPHDFSSPVGEVRATSLPDGSRIWLDSGAAVDFIEDAASRTLKVVRGRVHVSVAHHERLPFVVEAEGSIIHDIGTAFSVDTEGDGFRVAVAEGAVAVEIDGEQSLLAAGRSATYAPDQPAESRSFNVAEESAWRNGRIDLDRASLSEALRKADRYWPGRILLLAGDGSERVVSGSLSITNLEGSLAALAEGEQLRLTHLPFLLIVTTPAKK